MLLQSVVHDDIADIKQVRGLIYKTS